MDSGFNYLLKLLQKKLLIFSCKIRVYFFGNYVNGFNVSLSNDIKSPKFILLFSSLSLRTLKVLTVVNR